MRTRLPLLLLAAAAAALPAAAQISSENTPLLQRALERFPDADANKDGVLTAAEAAAYREARRNRARAPSARKPPLREITHADLVYGPRPRNRLDLWLAGTDAESDAPTPLLICIHGGGFMGGDKSKYHRNPVVPAMLERGISVAAINYTLTDGGANPYPIPMHDGARAVQYLRHHAAEHRLDPERFGALGSSAGGCMLLWLGFHDDLADPDAADPVARESTRLHVLAPGGGQSCLHLPTLREWFGVRSLREHPGGRPLFGLPPRGELTWTPAQEALALDASPITHLSEDDPPVYASYGSANKRVTPDTPPNEWVHHPVMGIRLQQAMRELGLECHVKYPGGPPVAEHGSLTEFLVRKLKPE